MWTADNRPRYNRDKLRYPSDLTDAEWAHIEPLIPPGKPGGGKRRVAIREVINGVMYILSTGCQWRALPKDLPPRSTVHDYLGLWNWDGTLDRIHHALYLKCREKAAREARKSCHHRLSMFENWAGLVRLVGTKRGRHREFPHATGVSDHTSPCANPPTTRPLSTLPRGPFCGARS